MFLSVSMYWNILFMFLVNNECCNVKIPTVKVAVGMSTLLLGIVRIRRFLQTVNELLIFGCLISLERVLIK